MPATLTLGAYIGPALRKIRMETGMSQADICRSLGKSHDYRSFISKIETGAGDAANMSIETLARLAQAVGSKPSVIVATAEGMLSIDAQVIVHLCPPKGSKVMPCCQRSTSDPALIDDRMTLRAAAVTCPGPEVKEA